MIEKHIPVMVEEVIFYLNCRDSGIYVDATVGDGGHAAAICRTLGPDGFLIGLDWDGAALERAAERLAKFKGKFILRQRSYAGLSEVLEEEGISQVDGILLDLGVSTLQLSDPSRGFSYQQDEPLDMRMDHRLEKSAADLVNGLPQAELSRLIYRYGEERWARRIAAGIVSTRKKSGPIESGAALAEVIKRAIPAAARRKGGHPARRTFQALRIAVNGELDNIEAVLPQAVTTLRPGGRICVIAYHSLEDRIVKRFFRKRSRRCSCPPMVPCTCGGDGELIRITRKAVRPSAEEVRDNFRARSALLRAAERSVLSSEEGA
ncbi:MAG TPA: 16S rRNA (cytosine(1402)-N(4))-methyltransferase RsmH [Firmicutes bacterium]|nr:16S rRNA (cytosine(1402)-N(4))-methyltransferase RsmH [Bacillota bacterium]